MADGEVPAVRAHRVANPAYLHLGDWYVDDGFDCVFFIHEADAVAYAAEVTADSFSEISGSGGTTSE